MLHGDHQSPITESERSPSQTIYICSKNTDTVIIEYITITKAVSGIHCYIGIHRQLQRSGGAILGPVAAGRTRGLSADPVYQWCAHRASDGPVPA